VKLVKAIGDNLAAVLRGETTMLEHMTKDNLLNRFYEIGLGLKEFSLILGKTVAQVVNRHPRMKILEIGKYTKLVIAYEMCQLIAYRCWNRWGNQKHSSRGWALVCFIHLY
jgi:hypothetical protein